MAVVTIIGLMAAAALPAMVEMVASTRQQGAAVDIAVLARRARSAALLQGKYAYAVMFNQLSGGGDGALQVTTGLTAYCNRATAIPINGPDDIITPPIGWQTTMGSIRLRSRGVGGHRVFATMEMPQGTNQGAMRVCYQPNGETHTYVGVGNGVGGEQTQAAVLFVRRTFGGSGAGIPRQIVFMPGGTARLR